MGLGKQAKILSGTQINALLHHAGTLRQGQRNRVIVLLSVKAGLRAKEISSLTWEMVTDAEEAIDDCIRLEDSASKGASGRTIPMNSNLKHEITLLYLESKKRKHFSASERVIRTERSPATSAQAIVNMFQGWFSSLGFSGCSSHSGRRTFVTIAAKKISTVGGSLRDVQMLAGHSSLQTTQRYIEADTSAQRRIVELIR